MKQWIKMLLITLVVGIPAFILGPVIWPPSPDLMPTPQQLPYFMFISAIEALLFGFGIAFIFYAWPFVKKASGAAKGRTVAMFIALSWLLLSWWPHDNFHIHNGMDMQGLLYIEYGFHLTLVIASLLVADFIYKTLKSASKA